MLWKTLRQRICPAMSEKERPLPRVYLAQVDGLIMGSVVSFGITNRCRYCKGTGRVRVSSTYRRCIHCAGKGYTEVDDTCMHVCGCTQKADKALVFICMDCFNESCDYPMSAWATT